MTINVEVGCMHGHHKDYCQLCARDQQIKTLQRRVVELEEENARIGRMRDMWKSQCKRQAEQLSAQQSAEPIAWLVTHSKYDSSVTQEKWLADAIKREHPNFTVTALGVIAAPQSLPEVKEE